jgi:1-deoxyxylulose-5-phosphate synthase
MTYGDPKWREWVLPEEQSVPFIKRAWEAGINFFDTANMYSVGASETVLGNALKALNIPREQVVIATKVRTKHEMHSNSLNPHLLHTVS